MAVSAAETRAWMLQQAEAQLAERRRLAQAGLEAAKRIAGLVAERFDATEVWLFGSMASGQVHARSDIDLAVKGVQAAHLPQIRDSVAELGLAFDVDLVGWDELGLAWQARIGAKGLRLR